jgi:hypothetical protein
MPEDDAGHDYPFNDIDEGEQTHDDAHFANDGFPPSGQLPIDLSNWNEPLEPEYEPDMQGEEGNNGQDEEQDGAEHEDEPPCPQPPPQPNQDEPLPRATYPMLMLAQQMVDSIKNATLEDDIHNPKLLHSIRHPPSENEPIDEITTLSLRIFLGLVGGSEKMYQNVQEALRLSDPLRPIHSYEVIRAKVERLTGITQIQTDMCINSCIAYTGPFESLEQCPKCATSRYEDPPTTSEPQQENPAQGEETHSNSRRGVARKPRKQYYTIPLGPQLQALWRTPEGAERMLYRQRKTNEIINQLRKNNGRVPVYDDIYHGSEYFNAWRTGQIKKDDMLLMFSIDAAQLYRDKQSDCSFSIWVILDISPDSRYQKMYILPAMFIPGPNSPDNTESFLLPAFRHVSALQKEGLCVWNGKDREYQQKRPFFFHGAADTVGIPTLNGLVGHTGGCGCRLACGHRGRRKPGQPTYYPASLKPKNYTVKGCDHADVDVATIGGPDKVLYDLNLRQLLQCTSKAGYTRTRLRTGIVRPSICSGFQEEAMIPVPRCFSIDLMHLLNLNLTQLLISIWRNSSDIKIQYGGEHGPKPDFITLDNEEVWQEHGKLVASTQPYFPLSFDRPPRNPAKKINSGFKACEYMLYFWAIGPAVFRIILPNHLWTHFCKLVCGIRAIFQRRITNEQVQVAHEMLNQWEKEFEEKYYAQEVSRLHLVRPCVHAVTHAARETVRCGPLNLVAQWALENTIGNLGREVHQHSNPFSNLAERGLLRAQMNALQAIFPEFNSLASSKLPTGDRARDLGNGYVLLFAHDQHPFKVLDNDELGILRPLLLALGVESGREISIIRWARLRLPNGQIARCAWKEIQNNNTRNSRNVKVIVILSHFAVLVIVLTLSRL